MKKPSNKVLFVLCLLCCIILSSVLSLYFVQNHSIHQNFIAGQSHLLKYINISEKEKFSAETIQELVREIGDDSSEKNKVLSAKMESFMNNFMDNVMYPMGGELYVLRDFQPSCTWKIEDNKLTIKYRKYLEYQYTYDVEGIVEKKVSLGTSRFFFSPYVVVNENNEYETLNYRKTTYVEAVNNGEKVVLTMYKSNSDDTETYSKVVSSELPVDKYDRFYYDYNNNLLPTLFEYTISNINRKY